MGISDDVREEPASVGQRMVWLLDHYRGRHGALNYPLLLRLRGKLDLDALHLALHQLVKRHETLRTSLHRSRGILSLAVHPPEPVAVSLQDLSGSAGVEAAIDQAVAKEVTTPIDPATSPLRITVWRASHEDHVLCMNVHHAATDAWSCGLLLRDLVRLLEQPDAAVASLPRVMWQYRHYARWERRFLASDGVRPHEAYWRDRLTGLHVPGLPFVETSPRVRTDQESGTVRVDLEGQLIADLRQLARRNQVSLYTVMLGVYYALLFRTTGNNDLAVTSLSANRTRPEVMQTVGFFVNLIIMRTQFSREASFIELLREANSTVTGALAHQQFPYYLLPADVTTPGDRRPDEIVFQMLPALPPPVWVGDLEIAVVVPEIASRFTLELALVPSGAGMRTLLQYSQDRIDSAWAAEFAATYALLARRVAAEPDLWITELAS
jgi:hypothetical protein